MNLKYMIELQGGLMEHIKKVKDIDEFSFKDTVLALFVELGELANETRCFKYWSKNRKPSEKTLEEYSDVGHLILQLGIILDFPFDDWVYKAWTTEDLTEQFLCLKLTLSEIYSDEHDGCIPELMSYYLGLGEMLGFTPEEIEKAYIEKNKINHERQNTGY